MYRSGPQHNFTPANVSLSLSEYHFICTGCLLINGVVLNVSAYVRVFSRCPSDTHGTETVRAVKRRRGR